MTVRTAELVMAIVTILCSIGLMVKSAELNIGWIEGSRPGLGRVALLVVARHAPGLGDDVGALVPSRDAGVAFE